MLTKVDQPVMFTLDGEPRGKGRPRFSRKNGVAFTPEPTRNYEAALRMAAQVAMIGRPLMLGPVRVSILAHKLVPDSWPKWQKAAALCGRWKCVSKPDIDNIMKMLDALNGVVFKDDSQIVEASVRKAYSMKPDIQIHIMPLQQASK